MKDLVKREREREIERRIWEEVEKDKFSSE